MLADPTVTVLAFESNLKADLSLAEAAQNGF
jgi:hypothetical protein